MSASGIVRNCDNDHDDESTRQLIVVSVPIATNHKHIFTCAKTEPVQIALMDLEETSPLINTLKESRDVFFIKVRLLMVS